MDLLMLQDSSKGVKQGFPLSSLQSQDRTQWTLWYCTLATTPRPVSVVLSRVHQHAYWRQSHLTLRFKQPAQSVSYTRTLTKITPGRSQGGVFVHQLYQSAVRYWYASSVRRVQVRRVWIYQLLRFHLSRLTVFFFFVRYTKWVHLMFYTTAIQYWRALMSLAFAKPGVRQVNFFGVGWYSDRARGAWWPLLSTVKYL